MVCQVIAMNIHVELENENKCPILSHYTKLEKALEILRSGKLVLRCNSFRFMNDPRECKAWRFNTTKNTKNDILCIENEFANKVKKNISAISFAMDHPNVYYKPDLRADYYYGYYRPRMWAQYAERHQGVCLVFDKEKLLKCFENSLSAKGDLYYGEVDYFDGDSIPQHLSGEIQDDVTNLLVQKNFDELENLIFSREHMRAYFFRKHGDWRDEAEYRILFKRKNLDQEEFKIDCRNALHDVIIGYACPNFDYPKEYNLTDEERKERINRQNMYEKLMSLKQDFPHIQKVRWSNGYPGQDFFFEVKYNQTK